MPAWIKSSPFITHTLLSIPLARRHGLVVIVAPRGDARVELTTTPSLKANKARGDDDAGNDQRGEDLMRGQAGGLHRHHLAVLVEADKGDQRAEQDREGEEAAK